ncbi:MAG: hypothetical protein ACQESJ_08695 [Bacteroidota bacterium]
MSRESYLVQASQAVPECKAISECISIKKRGDFYRTQPELELSAGNSHH